jgi:hypothetical protein
MKEETARRYLEDAGASAAVLETLLASGRALRVPYRAKIFLTRPLAPARRSP